MNGIDGIDLDALNFETFGSGEHPKPSIAFLRIYQRWLDWILTPDRIPSRATRIYALKTFLMSRLYRVRMDMIRLDEPPSDEQAVAYADESRALSELKQLEAAENGSAEDQGLEDKARAVHVTLVKSFATNAKILGLIDDGELDSQAAECRLLVDRYRARRQPLHRYFNIIQLLRLTWQRHLHFGTVSPTAVIPLVEEAEQAFVETRNAVTGLNPPDDLVAKVKMSEDFAHREHYNFALAALHAEFEIQREAHTGNPSPESQQSVFKTYSDLIQWSLRSKGRGFVDILSTTGAPLGAGMDSGLENLGSPSLNEKEQSFHSLVLAQTSALEREVQSSGPPSFDDMRSEIDDTVTKEQIDNILSELPGGTVIVDFVEFKYSKTGPALMAFVHRKGQPSFPRPLPVTMAVIDQWVVQNLDAAPSKAEPRVLNMSDASIKLDELKGLLEPLMRADTILLDEVIIFCPTGALNRVPIHAIPVNGRPLIERNPVAYCQSLASLHWLLTKFKQRDPTAPHQKRTIINPLPEQDDDGTPVASTEPVRDLARVLDAEIQRGFDLLTPDVLRAIEGSSVLHYHGHVAFNPRSALDSVLVLNAAQKRAVARVAKPAGCDLLTARRLFGLRLRAPALATIIGCGSGATVTSSTDDVLGIPTALLFAGASSVVSTLWPIDDSDGAMFGAAFYEAAIGTKTAASTGGAKDSTASQSSMLKGTVDLARALQTAVKKLRKSNDGESNTPYHWAAFTLNGLWFTPENLLPGRTNEG